MSALRLFLIRFTAVLSFLCAAAIPCIGICQTSKSLQPDAEGYVGSGRCVECHKDRHADFFESLHGRTARFTNAELEPRPGEFQHSPSRSKYKSEVVDADLFHTEERLSRDGESLGTTRMRMNVSLGSGSNSISYLARVGPFHIESPVTYFRDVEQWSISPGYDTATHQSFTRAVTVGCVFCHVGSIQQINANPYKFEILEASIGCERCHGPGQNHIAHHRERAAFLRSDDTPPKAPDDPIVNPRSLPRDLSEAVCQQCHCQGPIELGVQGQNSWDYRPGKRLTDFRVDFQLKSSGSATMSLVGHVEQLHQSQCYKETTTLTCVTCHDPHVTLADENRVAYHRQKCNECHRDQTCDVDISVRLANNNDDCAGCHMPRRDTNVSHFALHNHKIGVYSDIEIEATEVATRCEPILDISHLPTGEQTRLRSLAKYEMYRRYGGDKQYAHLRIEATQELISLKQQGVVDPHVDAALVWLAWDQGQFEIAESIAREVIDSEVAETKPRIDAVNTLARILLDRGQASQARRYYQSLEQFHRDSGHSYFLGLAEQNCGNSPAAINALLRSIEIDPSQSAAHHALNAIYTSLGETKLAEQHAELAAQNERRKRPSD